MGKTRHPRTPAMAYDIVEWMQGLVGDSDGDPKQNDDTNHRTDQRGNHSQLRSWGQRRPRWQRAPQLPREPSGGLPSSGGNSSDGQSECSSWHSNQMRVSRESGQSEWAGKSFRVKLICPPLKTKRPKMPWPTTHGNGICLCFADLVGMTVTCCPISSGLCKDSQETWWGVWVRMPPWVMSSRCWTNTMVLWWLLMP